MTHSILRCLFVTAIFGSTRFAHAGPFAGADVQLNLSERQDSALVKLENTSDLPMHFRISAWSWAQDGDDLLILEPTADLSVVPSMVTLEPGATRKVRVSTKTPAREDEGAYRIVVEELPSLQDDSLALDMDIRDQASLPVFVAPERQIANGRIERIGLDGGRVELEIANDGSVHFLLQKVEIAGYDLNEGITFTEVLEGSYVLPDTARPIVVQVPPEVCQATRTIEIRALTDRGIWSRALSMGAARCWE